MLHEHLFVRTGLFLSSCDSVLPKMPGSPSYSPLLEQALPCLRLHYPMLHGLQLICSTLLNSTSTSAFCFFTAATFAWTKLPMHDDGGSTP